MPIDYKKLFPQETEEQNSKIILPSHISSIQDVELILSQVTDPEIPVINIVELGILRRVERVNDVFEIEITPTYVGCPAMGVIEMNIKAILDTYQGIKYKIITKLSPPWTTAWLSEQGKQKLKNYGIAPPLEQKRIQKLFEGQGQITCPRCNSVHTSLISEFGSTACKSMYKCNDCLEAFDYFKCH